MANHPSFFVGKPNLGSRQAFLNRINRILDNHWFSNNGPMVQEFEAKVAKFLGVQHAVAVCNATAAIEIACRGLGLEGEVIVPSYTFIATAHALQWQGITPVFCDIDPRTHNIDPSKIERHITPRTTGIIGVHLWGRGCDTRAIEEIGQNRGLKVLYDASHGFGCSTNGDTIGSNGECEIFSFHATKFINSLEGGIVATNNETLASKIRVMTNFGFTGYDQVDHLGINGKMNEMSAAMGLTNLESIESFIDTNRQNYEAYCSSLKGLPGISVIKYNLEEKNNFQYVVLEVDPRECPCSRDELVESLHSKKIIARRYFWPGCHNMEPYRSLQPNAGLLLPETDRLASRVIVLPTGQHVDIDSVKLICYYIRSTIQEAATKG
jgi:dTDP-4-amino-4,6-dideoxygalactose transaminase